MELRFYFLFLGQVLLLNLLTVTQLTIRLPTVDDSSAKAPSAGDSPVKTMPVKELVTHYLPFLTHLPLRENYLLSEQRNPPTKDLRADNTLRSTY